MTIPNHSALIGDAKLIRQYQCQKTYRLQRERIAITEKYVKRIIRPSMMSKSYEGFIIIFSPFSKSLYESQSSTTGLGDS